MDKNFVSRFLLLIMGLLVSGVSFAQDNVQMADKMRSNGKIYVVVAVCLTILTGLFLYLVLLDRKMRRIEKSRNTE